MASVRDLDLIASLFTPDTDHVMFAITLSCTILALCQLFAYIPHANRVISKAAEHSVMCAMIYIPLQRLGMMTCLAIVTPAVLCNMWRLQHSNGLLSASDISICLASISACLVDSAGLRSAALFATARVNVDLVMVVAVLCHLPELTDAFVGFGGYCRLLCFRSWRRAFGPWWRSDIGLPTKTLRAFLRLSLIRVIFPRPRDTLLVDAETPEAAMLCVSQILDVRYGKSRADQIVEYLAEFADGSSVWVSLEDCLAGCEDVVADFHAKNPYKPRWLAESEEFIDATGTERQGSPGPAIKAIECFLGLSTSQDDVHDGRGAVDSVALREEQARLTLILHLLSIVLHGRLLGSVPGMTAWKMLVLHLGSLLFAGEAELILRDQTTSTQQTRRRALGGSFGAAFGTAAGVLAPRASVGYGVGLYFIPMPIAFVGLCHVVGELSLQRKEPGVGSARRLGACLFGLLFAVVHIVWSGGAVWPWMRVQ